MKEKVKVKEQQNTLHRLHSMISSEWLATLFNELFAHRPTPLRQGAKQVKTQTASHLQLAPVLRRAARRAPSAAKTSFVADGGCKRDYALPCPKGWCLATDQACVAPFNWKGVCAIRDAALPKMTAEGKERRGTVCDTPYPCDDDFAAHQPRNIYCPDVPEDNAPPIPIAQEDAAGKNGVPPGVTRTDVMVQISNKPSQKFFQPLQEGALQNEANAGRPENPNVASEKLVVGEDGALHKLELMDAYHVGGPKKAMRGKAVLADGTLPYSKKQPLKLEAGEKEHLALENQRDFRFGMPESAMQDAIDAMGGIQEQ
eukprot:g9053.t1